MILNWKELGEKQVLFPATVELNLNSFRDKLTITLKTIQVR